MVPWPAASWSMVLDGRRQRDEVDGKRDQTRDQTKNDKGAEYSDIIPPLSPFMPVLAGPLRLPAELRLVLGAQPGLVASALSPPLALSAAHPNQTSHFSFLRKAGAAAKQAQGPSKPP